MTTVALIPIAVARHCKASSEIKLFEIHPRVLRLTVSPEIILPTHSPFKFFAALDSTNPIVLAFVYGLGMTLQAAVVSEAFAANITTAA